jgi:hypothetical protein
MKVQYYLLLGLVLILLVGCQPPDSTLTDEPTLSPSFENFDTLTPSMTSDTPDPAVQELVLQAQAHLAQKLGIDTDNIFPFSVEVVEWPDASLGCPQTDMLYAQVVTPGYRILLEANGQVYTYHTDKADQVILCSARGPDEIYLPP